MIFVVYDFQVYLLDRSGSMTGDALTGAKLALIEALRHMSPQVFNIICRLELHQLGHVCNLCVQ